MIASESRTPASSSTIKMEAVDVRSIAPPGIVEPFGEWRQAIDLRQLDRERRPAPELARDVNQSARGLDDSP
jgi:hypothetical protein